MSMLREDQARTSDTAVLSEINITPFTDVLLVLLIIFMILASLAIPPGFERQFAPCACGSPLTKTSQHIAVVVTQRGGIFVNGESTSVTRIYPVLARIHAQLPRAAVTLYADAKAPYGAIMRVLDAAKAGGVPDVSFATE
ncbi:MAG TPA: biopolymer transporter ExbD [Candidatus Baltobacteraceae bacterium]|nr:biopolymer transporter ExbD [Candidatus Baltobacteraceae bacterium]